MSDSEGMLLEGIRIVDMSDGRGELCGRYLADLGADVVLVEPPGGNAARRRPPLVGSTSTHFAAHHYNKRGVELDLATEDGRRELLELLAAADVWIETAAPSAPRPAGLDLEQVLQLFPQLVVVSITDFGLTGPYRDHQATDAVLMAMAGHLSQSGLPGEPPLLPPRGLGEDSAALQAAWVTMLALANREATGYGDHLDVSLLETTAQVIDPPMGAVGSAAAGRSGMAVPRGRPASAMYPVYACADGDVRMVVLATRQWQALRAWMGEPEQLADPALESIGGRMRAAAEVQAAVAGFLSGLSVDEVVREGQRRGVPVAPVLHADQVVREEHYRVRGAIVTAEVAPGVRGEIPSGLVEVDGRRAGFRRRAPIPGEHTDEVREQFARAERPEPPTGPRPGRRTPLEGIRVLDLGTIVMGAEAGRLFADQGAEVIKVENRAFPDGARAAITGLMTASFAAGHRNKLAVGINLRSAAGANVLKRLVARSDVLLENYKPGTLEGLGLGWDVLREVNPALVMGSSSAMGHDGPWSNWMGYGPLARCATGLTQRWSDPDHPGSYSDSVTIFPDHLAARVVDTAVLAALLKAKRTGRGAHITSAQAEVILGTMAGTLLAESLDAGAGRGGWDAPWGVYPCAGDDEWCVVTVRDDDDWAALVGAVGAPDWATDPALRHRAERLAGAASLDENLGRWTSARSPDEVAAALQSVGVPAGPMRRAADYESDPHFAERGLIRYMEQPGVNGLMPVENGPCSSIGIADPPLRPAPLLGQHTRQVLTRVGGLTPDEIDTLFADRSIEETVPADEWTS